VDVKQLGWNADVQRRFDELNLAGTGLAPARVARQDRDSYVVYAAVSQRPSPEGLGVAGGGVCRALRVSLRGALRHSAGSAMDLPAVGDWVAVHVRPGQADGRIEAVARRRSCVVRQAPGGVVAEQVLAANVDALLVCCGLDHDYNLRRIERYLTFAYGSGAAPVIVLTKADVCGPAVEERVAEVESIAIGVPVLAVSMFAPARLRELIAPFVPRTMTAALVGSSGAGKSTLINVLLDRQVMRTGAVRAWDSRGRHTTTHRQLLLVPDGGVIIDSPGMRELQLWNDAGDVDATFADVAALAVRCRFRDCAHAGEPGCAVRAAVERGALPAERLASYHKQARELAWLERKADPVARAEETARWKALHKAARKRYRQKHGGENG